MGIELTFKDIAFLVASGSFATGYLLKIALPYTAIGKKTNMLPNGDIMKRIDAKLERIDKSLDRVSIYLEAYLKARSDSP